MDSSLSEILRHLLQLVRILDGLKKDVSANKDHIETQQLKLQEQELDITNNKDEIVALQQKVERYQDKTLQQFLKVTMENSDEICRIKQKEDDTTGMCWS
jgi:hypothetical protein